jgi:hypothetical protein
MGVLLIIEKQMSDNTSDSITEKMNSFATGHVARFPFTYGWGMQGSTDGASNIFIAI